MAIHNLLDEPIPALENKTPRPAIKTAAGLERVKGLLRSYEAGEAVQAEAQGAQKYRTIFCGRRSE